MNRKCKHLNVEVQSAPLRVWCKDCSSMFQPIREGRPKDLQVRLNRGSIVFPYRKRRQFFIVSGCEGMKFNLVSV